MADSFFFYDLETSGVNPRTARVMQFAGQRTDLELNPIGDPVNVLIKLSDDIVPEPEAILITGITPQRTLAEGITEAEFLHEFESGIATPGTTFAGYNTVRFDDEFMRFMLYRNFHDPYEWQWKDDRSRWDLLDVVRMTRALRPDGIEWPFDSSGKPSNRLELLTSVNGLDHSNAHDALNDVMATIELARLIKGRQTKLFEYLLRLRKKSEVAKVVRSGEPFVYASGKYPSEYQKTTVVANLADHPNRSDAVLVYDLRHDPGQYLDMNPVELADCWRWKPDRTEPRLPVKSLMFNRCPAVAPLAVLDEASQERLRLDRRQLQQNAEKLRGQDKFVKNLYEAIKILDKQQQVKLIEDELDVDNRLYDSFIPDSDKPLMQQVRQSSTKELSAIQLRFKDARLRGLLPLYKARNFPESMSPSEQEVWQQHRHRVLYEGGESSRLADYFRRLSQLSERQLTGEQRYLLEELELYGQSLMPEL